MVLQGCKKQFTIKVGTIFEDSPLGMDKWMTAVWLIANCKNGVSSYEVARDLGITQKSAWFMLHRIRKAMQDGSLVKVGGNGSEVEVDETYIGGKARNMHKHRKQRLTGVLTDDKTTVMGFLERGGKVRTAIVGSRQSESIQPMVRKHVHAGTALFTDNLAAYRGLYDEYEHQIIDHANRYVDGKVHTNGLENFWSLLKRGLGGTYVSVEPFHLFRYVDEQAFRFNHRKTEKRPLTDADRFALVMSNVFGRRLTWSQLTGKEATTTPVN